MYLPEHQNTAWQNSHEIDIKKTAVLVIDLLGGKLGNIPALDEAVKNATTIVNKARELNIPVIFSCDAHIPGVDKELELWGEHGIKGSEAAKPLSVFNVSSSDFIVYKRRYNGFFQTDLDLLLRELGVDTIIAFGADTNICVLQTLANAYYLGYKTIVPADACATFLIGKQEDGLDYFSRCYDSRVIDTKALLENLK